MDTDVTSADVGSAATDRLHLTSIVVIVASMLFVTLLVMFTGDPGVFWPLYLVPIVIAALMHEIPGAVLTTTLSAGIVALVVPGADISPSSRLAIVAGFLTFLVCGVVMGAWSGRSRAHDYELERVSVCDPDTGLLKPSALRERLAQEVQRGARHDVDVTLVVAHINELESFRETFGSYKMGLLLEHMADIVRIAVRDTDIVGRYAPDAIAIVAAFAGPPEAVIIADRIRGAVCDARFEGDVLQPAACCSVTIAHASTPREATGLDALVGLAEQRLATAVAANPAETDDAPPLDAQCASKVGG